MFAFNSVDFKSLLNLLGDADEVRKLEKVISLLKTELGQPGSAFADLPSPLERRATSKRLAKAAERFRKELDAVGPGHFNHFDSFVRLGLNEHGEEVFDEECAQREWVQLRELVGRMEADAVAHVRTVKVKTRAMPPDERAWGAVLMSFLENAGVRRSHAPESVMAQAFAIIFAALDWRRISAEAFIKAISQKQR